MKRRITRRDINTGLAQFQQSFPDIIRRIYVARGVTQDQQLQYGLDQLHGGDGLLGLSAALTCLTQAITQQQRILIIGDFDADGATSSALAVCALRAFGAEHVDYLVPNRFTYGYGLTPAIVAVASRWRPDVIITVDNGIASCDGVEAANQQGIRVVITDHHLPGKRLPAAAAIVNPNQVGDLFPSKNLAGVGVIFYLLGLLRGHLRAQGWFSAQGLVEPSMAQFLDLVALGTVADVVALDHTNRILVHQGLARIRAGQARPGIYALLTLAKRKADTLVASDLGFAVAPRLNAAGRLDDMAQGIECLLAEDPGQAMRLAQVLDGLNEERRSLEAQMKSQALLALQHLQLPTATLPAALCLFDASWHQGVIGIIAGRLKDQFHRPTIVFADSGEGCLKGSGRSIPGVHLRDVLDEVATRYPGLLTHFGGHAMAAGLSLDKASLAEFQQAFVTVMGNYIDAKVQSADIMSDGELPVDCFTLSFAEQLRAMGPWGQSFPEPLFDGQFQVLEQRLVGAKHLKLTLVVPQTGQLVDAIWFYVDVEAWPNHRCTTVNAAYRLDVNIYQEVRRLQLLVEYLEAV